MTDRFFVFRQSWSELNYSKGLLEPETRERWHSRRNLYNCSSRAAQYIVPKPELYE